MINSYGYLFMLLAPLWVRDRIRATTGLVGPIRSPILPHMFHMTLIEIADRPERWPEITSLMRAMLSDHQLCACTFALRRLVVEPGIATLQTVGRRPELNALEQGLKALLLGAGMSFRRKKFAPHVTLGRGTFSEQDRLIDPIFWHADQIALVESWRGETHYEILETWLLLPPVQGSFDFALAA